MEQDDVAAVLSRNFKDVPPDRRHAYAARSGRCLRVATDLCHQDPMATNPDVLGSDLMNYLIWRVTETRADSLSALSLFWRIGWKESSKKQLKKLAKLTGLKKRELKEALEDIKKGPGGRRYLTSKVLGYNLPHLLVRVVIYAFHERIQQFIWHFAEERPAFRHDLPALPSLSRQEVPLRSSENLNTDPNLALLPRIQHAGIRLKLGCTHELRGVRIPPADRSEEFAIAHESPVNESMIVQLLRQDYPRFGSFFRSRLNLLTCSVTSEEDGAGESIKRRCCGVAACAAR